MENVKQMKHILIVDDVTTNLKCAAEVLKKYYKLSMAKSGRQALDFLKEVKPDLILLDIRMPEMDGYETLAEIRENPETQYIPVVFLTADSDRESEIKGLKMGAMDFIRTPFEPEIMLSRIDKIIQMEEIRKGLAISANQDVLTNLWNRKYMEDEIARFVMDDSAIGIFMILDMDNFKRINDNFGHIMGDAVLVQFADTLKSLIGESGTICRIGGDEFAIFLPGNFSTVEVSDLVEAIISQVETNANKVCGDEYAISVSVGISRIPDDAENFMDLYNKADKALYFVKQNGKRGYHFYKERDTYEFGTEISSSMVDIKSLKKFVEEKFFSNGAYKVEYSGFKHIYQFVSRSIGRTKQPVQIVLFTIDGPSVLLNNEELLLYTMKKLEQSIVASLRRGDVATHFSSTQYVVILMDASPENGEKVASRVAKTWTKLNEMKELVVSYDIETVDMEQIQK